MIRAEDYSPPLDRALELIHTAKSSFVAVILCNPNSPTGQLVPRHQLLKFIDALTKMHVWTIVDESFIEFASEHSVLTELLTYPRLLVLRSFSKFYGLPVLRIGYLVGPSHIVERLRLCQPPWSVNALAQRAAVAALKDSNHHRKSLALVSAERTRLSAALRTIEGMRVFPSAANFLLLELPSPLLASHIVAQLRACFMLVRDCSSLSLASLRDRFELRSRLHATMIGCSKVAFGLR